jgi:hypothetical protein
MIYNASLNEIIVCVIPASQTASTPSVGWLRFMRHTDRHACVRACVRACMQLTVGSKTWRPRCCQVRDVVVGGRAGERTAGIIL